MDCECVNRLDVCVCVCIFETLLAANSSHASHSYSLANQIWACQSTNHNPLWAWDRLRYDSAEQCCQLSNFVAKFSNFSDCPSNFFFQKHLATNSAIFYIYLATFSNFW